MERQSVQSSFIVCHPFRTEGSVQCIICRNLQFVTVSDIISAEVKDVINELLKMQDMGYRDFHSKLMPTVDKSKIIGVRVPDLRKLAKRMAGSEEANAFIRKLPHEYYEENNLHAFLLESIKDFESALSETERFLPYIDNWATCDMFYPKVFKSNEEKLMPRIDEWIKSGKTYTIRYAIGLLMRMDLKKDHMEAVAGVRSDEYYVNMMIAWYFATALAKNYPVAIEYLEENRLSEWVHNKTIQKATESYRIDAPTKEILRGLKR